MKTPGLHPAEQIHTALFMWPPRSNKPICAHKLCEATNSWILNPNLINTPDLNALSVVSLLHFSYTLIADVTVMRIYPHETPRTISDVVKLTPNHQKC